jgi:hypothetical protein
MVKSKVKIAELIKKIKIPEIKHSFLKMSTDEKETNQKATDIKNNAKISQSVSLTIAQKEIPRATKETIEQVREELRNREKEISYLSTVEASLNSAKSYDPSIKQNTPSFDLKNQQSSSPTIQSSNVKEKKKEMKITEIKDTRVISQRNLEKTVSMQEDFPILSSQGARISPTLSQSSGTMFNRKTPQQIREELRKKDKEFSYLATVQASASTTKSYDPSIKSGSAFFEAQSRAERINPTISASPIQEVQSRSLSIRDALNQGSVEPGLRTFNDQSKEYKTERVEKYIAKRRTE